MTPPTMLEAHGTPKPVIPAAGQRTLRVVHVINYLATGGLEKGISTMVRHRSPDIEHVIVAMTGTRDPEKIVPPGTRVIDMRKPSGHSIRFIWKLSRVLRDLSPCVVHTRNWVGMDGVIAARLAGIKAIVHGEHGWGADDPNGTNRKRIVARRYLSRWMRACLCVSKDLERWLKETVRVRCPVVQIYNGVDTSALTGPSTAAEVKAEFGMPPDALLVGLIGRLDAIKDHPTLFRAMAKVRERFPRVELLCAGEGPARDELEKLATPGIRLLGNRHDAPRLLRALDLYVLASRNEGISNTILEAMGAQLPVVASRVGGNPELVDDGVTGTLFPAGDVPALVAAIEGYLGDAQRRAAHGAAGRAKVHRIFRTEAMVRAYEDVWRACAKHLR